MRKKLVFLLVTLFVAGSLLIGCGTAQQPAVTEEKPAEEKPIEEKPAAVEKKQISILTGSTGGTYFALGGSMANTWNNYSELVQVTSQPSGASVENMNRLHAGEVELGMAMNNIADDAWNGRGAFKEKQQNFRTVAVIYPEVYQGVALADSKINSLADVKGKRVAVGPVGSGTVVLTEAVFAEAGLTFNDVKAAYDGFGDASGKMKDGHLDAAFNVLSVPAAAITDIQLTREINIIEIGDELYSKIKAKHPFFSQYIIPAGTYGNKEDVKTINCQAALYVQKDVPEEIVYELTKIWVEKAGEVANAHGAAKWLSDELAAGNKDALLAGLTTPLHKGAYKYFQEQGIAVPEAIKPID
ncbi:MAG TPA: TAXI family TRAP transporter solute-binding subunit [Bacillota bacterium]|jgi:TRAP transporter TAXI family solute receptor|nr:TAXI family TRAP transporter solute-binding subunit [Bacillota bacterium]HRS20512.1 TAXI family TRAP transporter solute-binding subunit [Clostridia bacterium]HRU41723.1 TAXI family TRAP transporter solute-binding subunit [Candidatus Diapherotrites archaeon]HQE66657.1 TAXI family TRAP transporter solute-binding subunit [Bacillota bacterium]HQI16007.1 TAXI family TRAP transporter solute-binding subunit [Bacillota bacterium]